MTRRPLPALALAAVSSLTVASGALAEPVLFGQLQAEIQLDQLVSADGTPGELRDLQPKIDFEPRIRLGEDWVFGAHLVLQADPAADPTGDRYFEDDILFLEEIFVTYSRGPVALQLGKQPINFGIGYFAAPGVYGNEVAQASYEVSEVWALNGSYSFATAPFGELTLGVGVFFQDTTQLSNSGLRIRGRLREQDGGLANTQSPESVNFWIDGERVGQVEGFWRLALMRRAPGVTEQTDELGIAVTVEPRFELGQVAGEDLVLTPLLEGVHFHDAGGVDGARQSFLLTAAALDWGAWTLSAANTQTFQGGVSDAPDSRLTDVTIGRELAYGFRLDLGWRQIGETGADSDTLGALLTWRTDL